MDRIIGGTEIVHTPSKYKRYSKLAFFEMVGPDVIYAVGRSSKKSLFFMNKLLEASNSVDFNNPQYRLLFLSLVPEGLVTLEQAEAIMGAAHE